MDENKVIEAIKILKNEKPGCGEKVIYTESEKCESYELAIEALEKQLPKKVEIKDWSPSKCPNCGCELSEFIGDGHYIHPTFLEVCPNCYQKLKW